MKNTNNNHGYSLIELTVVVGLVSILAVAITAIMMSSLLSSVRVRNMIRIRQSGDYTITQIEQMIRNALDIINCNDWEPNQVVIRNQDGNLTYIYYDIAEDRIASDSGSTTYYLTSDRTSTQNFSVNCEPSVINPTLISISFTLSDVNTSGKARDDVSAKFETSVELRNR